MKKITHIFMLTIVLLTSYSLKAQNWLLAGNNVTATQFLGTIAGDADPLVFKTNGVERMRILSSGNIGIGSTTSTYKLSVNGTMYVAKNMILGPDDNVNEGAQLRFSGAAAYRYFTIDNYQGNLRLFTLNEGGTASTKFFMSNAGNVGIGTITPGSYKLAVEGKIGAREVVITNTAWADFVFNENYKLNSLSEVEKFIKENKHLPDVPSEKTVLKEGINMGKMDATLLQKIEELTLYVITLNKENESLKQRVALLEKKL
jgi:hypothetical protein